MIELKIENMDQAKAAAETAIRCTLAISFVMTPENLDALNNQIQVQAPENPGVEFEMRTQLREKYSCNICGRQEFIAYGKSLPRCRCNPHQKWVKEEK